LGRGAGNRAARPSALTAEDGIVGTYNGSNTRDVLLTPEQWEALRGEGDEEGEAA
jgi:S-DNA-T family DNA segregation ATPase FtsK/SpoIIIE